MNDVADEETGKVTSPKKNGTQDAAVGVTAGKKAPVPPSSGASFVLSGKL